MNNYFGAMLRYFEFNGRSSRREYWWYSITFMTVIVAAIYTDITVLNSPNLRSSVLLWFVIIIHIIPGMSLTVRRLHDGGKSGWWYWISLVPFIGGFWLFYLTAIRGPEYEAQQYGPDPREPGALAPAATQRDRHQPLTRSQMLVRQMDERRRRMA